MYETPAPFTYRDAYALAPDMADELYDVMQLQAHAGDHTADSPEKREFLLRRAAIYDRYAGGPDAPQWKIDADSEAIHSAVQLFDFDKRHHMGGSHYDVDHEVWKEQGLRAYVRQEYVTWLTARTEG
ncbi:hypothetical protein ACH427_32260 [Streptomyces sp. NPDC020379]|uniref:hypothetical protein n=1 Tax=Streptomyces sp. NPDC020379 TaxID=3365071 RepID=UPI0037AD40CB